MRPITETEVKSWEANFDIHKSTLCALCGKPFGAHSVPVKLKPDS